MAEKEYIERGAFAERLQDFSEWCRDGRKQGVDFVLDCPLPNMPTADEVEVVRCKDCKHYSDFDTNKCQRLAFHFCMIFDYITKEHDFCSNGVRKEYQ